MARRKTEYTLPAWMSARVDSREKRFIQVGDSLLFSPKFQELSAGARLLYFSMAMESAGKREFEFPLATALKHGVSRASFRRYVDELVEAKFLTVDSGRTTREPNKYKFSFEWKLKEAPK